MGYKENSISLNLKFMGDIVEDLELADAVSLLEQLVSIFLRETPKKLDAVREAIAQEDAKGLRASAHSLKSSSAMLGADTVSELSWKLESMGQSGELARAREVLGSLEKECELVYQQLCTLRTEQFSVLLR
ncbi:Hpt domain-containing protein [Heliobacterium chlorum]|uniref:Hpt domain-containing protein n=1 Tax=Heliobacterium chlorum TaxID=2698 RepID=A0ABR7T5M3_HELCL|nr:Hpt domain-containing protein [Heliobacterium chlorum]MBC9786080.1 Hpt domain-containing protein [Heliobacterium chlorum]